MSPFPAIEHLWVIQAMVASYNHIYQVVHGTKYQELGAIGVSDYGDAAIASFQIEFLAMDDDPKKVVKAIKKYKVGSRKYVLDVFHGMPSSREAKEKYAAHGYEFVRTSPIFGMDLPGPSIMNTGVIKKIENLEQLDLANQHLSVENQTIPAKSVSDSQIHNYVAEWNGRVTGWAQLVTVFPGVGYIHQLYTLMDYRNTRVGSSLLTHMHAECEKLGIPRMALVSSEMSMGLYRRFGYSPLAFFTSLRPSDKKAS